MTSKKQNSTITIPSRTMEIDCFYSSQVDQSDCLSNHPRYVLFKKSVIIAVDILKYKYGRRDDQK